MTEWHAFVRIFFTGLNAAPPRAGASGPGRAGHAAWRPFRARPVPSAARAHTTSAPWLSTRALLQLRRHSASTALLTGGAGSWVAAVSPSRHGRDRPPFQTR